MVISSSSPVVSHHHLPKQGCRQIFLYKQKMAIQGGNCKGGFNDEFAFPGIKEYKARSRVPSMAVVAYVHKLFRKQLLFSAGG